MLYDIYPQYDNEGLPYRGEVIASGKAPVMRNVALNGPHPGNTQDSIVSAVSDTAIEGEITVLRTWFSSNGLNIIGFEKNKATGVVRHQEWWCVASKGKP